MTSPFSDYPLRYELLKFCSIAGWHNPHAITLTFRQGRRIAISANTNWGSLKGSPAEVFQSLEHDHCVQAFRHFMNVMNRQAFGNAARRYGKRLRVIPVLEGDDQTRFHYHAAVECPSNLPAAEFPDLVKSSWSRTDWSHEQVDVQPSADDGWLRYITKLQTKRDFSLAIDWMNFHTF